MTDISRIPTDLEWTAVNGAHERLPIGRIIRDQAAEIERLRAIIHEAEFCLTVAVVPDGHERCEMALKKLRANQQSTTEPKCTCPEDWQGMDHTEGCKSRASR